MKFILGTANFGQKYGLIDNKKVEFDEISKIINICKKNNIINIDTSDMYLNAEKNLSNLNLDQFNIITKINFNKINNNNLEKYINNFIDKRLRLFKKNKLYCVLIHQSQDLERNKNIAEIIKKVINENKVLKSGLSIYSEDDINLKYKEIYNIIQLPANLFDKRLVKSKVVRKLQKKGTLIYARSIFLQGLLIQKKIKNKYFEKWETEINKYIKWLKINNIDPIDACLNFINMNNFDGSIIGVNNSIQLKRIINFKKRNIKFPNFLKTNDKKILLPYNWEL